MLYTTFNLLKENNACTEEYRKLAKLLGGIEKYGRETPIALLTILNMRPNGLSNALWSLGRCTEPEKAKRVSQTLACDYAEQVVAIYEKAYPGDGRPRNAIETTRKYLNGTATVEELGAAWSAARNAAWSAAWSAADAAWSAARNAARSAAWSAADAARNAAWSAAWSAADAARNAAWSAADAARSAADAAWSAADAARSAAWSAAWSAADAARSAAWSAARNAARSAAWSAADAWQSKHLKDLLEACE